MAGSLWRFEIPHLAAWLRNHICASDLIRSTELTAAPYMHRGAHIPGKSSKTIPIPPFSSLRTSIVDKNNVHDGMRLLIAQ